MLRGWASGSIVSPHMPSAAKAGTRSAHREAVECFEQALGALAHLPENHETIEQAIDLRLEVRSALFTLGEVRRGFDRLCEAEILAERISDQRRLGWTLAFMAGHFWLSGDLDRAVE